MRFGISATSSIFPKNFLTRFRPINVCAIMSSRSIEPSDSSAGGKAGIQPSPRREGDRYREGICARRSEAARRSSRLSRGPQSIATVGTGVARLVFPLVSPIRLRSESASMLCRTLKAGGSRPIYFVFMGSPVHCSARPRGPRLNKHSLLKLNLGADFFELRLDLGSLVLVDAFLDVFRRAFNEILGLFEPETGNGANFLDDFDLFLAGSSENHRDFGLFLGGRRCGAACRGPRSDRDCCGGRNTPLLFE